MKSLLIVAALASFPVGNALADSFISPDPYTVDRESDANNCELFINSLGQQTRHYTGGGYDEQLFVIYISVNARKLVDQEGGEILAVGVRMNGVDDLIERREVEPA